MIVAFDYSYISKQDLKNEGICRYNSFLIEHLLKNDTDLIVEIWCMKDKYPAILKSFDNFYSMYKKRIFFLMSKKYPFPSDSFFLRKISHNTLLHKIKKSKADIVFVDSFFTTGNLSFNGPKVFALHDLFTILIPLRLKEYDVDIESFNKYAIESLEKYVKLGAKIVTFTSYTKESQLCYIRNLNYNDCEVIDYPTMLPKKFTFLTRKEIEKIIGTNKPYIFYPSQNRPTKNFITLLKALNLLIKKRNIVLVTTGDMNLLSITRDFIKNNNLSSNIIQLKYISDNILLSLYKYSGCVAVPTIAEGPGLPQQVKEALTIGCSPVICTKCLGVEESLKDHNLNFAVADLNWVEIDDYKTMAIKIDAAINNRLSHIKKQSKIIKNYQKTTWDKVAVTFLKIFKEEITKQNK